MTSFSKLIAACAIFLVICIGILSYWSEVRNEENLGWVTHTHLVVEKLQAISIDITQAETGQRGYLLTGSDTYLAPYGAAVDKLGRDTEALRELTSDNPTSRGFVQRLEPLIADRLTELADGVQVRKRSGPLAGVEAATHGNDGEIWMQLIASHIAQMRQSEAQLLKARLDTANASSRNMRAVIVWGNTLVVLILFGKGVVVHREIGRRILAEQKLNNTNERLERRTAELSETNIELESFTYSVAHDLRAPLRHISGFAGIVLQNYGPRLDSEGVRCLDKITSSATKMGRLVDDLLNLAQVGRRELLFQDTSLDSLLNEVMDELRPECAGRVVEWKIDKLFTVECDSGLMKQVFVNLLSNAVKYTRTRDHAVIQVGQTTKNGERVVFVRDNGVGFEMQFAGKLFGVFQRLHKFQDFEGTGVGLAIVQRIVRKHGGNIWAEAIIDQGATFFFTLGTPESIPIEQEFPVIEEEMHVARS